VKNGREATCRDRTEEEVSNAQVKRRRLRQKPSPQDLKDPYVAHLCWRCGCAVCCVHAAAGNRVGRRADLAVLRVLCAVRRSQLVQPVSAVDTIASNLDYAITHTQVCA
jgi:hypothetical protein